MPGGNLIQKRESYIPSVFFFINFLIEQWGDLELKAILNL